MGRFFVCPSVFLSVHLSVHPSFSPSGPSDQAWGPDLRPSQPGLRPEASFVGESLSLFYYWSKSAIKTFFKVSSVPLCSHINYNKFKQTTKNLRHVFGGPPGRLQLHLEASGINQTRYNQRDFLKTHPGSSWQAIPAHSGPVACVCPLQTFNWTIESYHELFHTKGTWK